MAYRQWQWVMCKLTKTCSLKQDWCICSLFVAHGPAWCKVAMTMTASLIVTLMVTMVSLTVTCIHVTIDWTTPKCIQSVTCIDADREDLSPFVASTKNNNDIWTQTWLNSFSKDVIKKSKRNRMFSELDWQFSWDTRCSLSPTVFTFFSCRQKGFQLRSLDSAVKRLECVSPFVTLLCFGLFSFLKKLPSCWGWVWGSREQ